MLALARNVLGFIFATGQRYRFEDFSKRALAAVAEPLEGSAALRELLGRTESFFLKLLDEPESTGEEVRIQAILDALRFIEATDQYAALDAYLKHVELNAPPFVVASFESAGEAEVWLKNHSHPPDPASVLIADSYHDVVHDRETNIRRLPRNRDLHGYLTELKRVNPPIAVAAFVTREEAEAWLNGQAEPARWQWVSISGEFYLAAYYPNIAHRALYPLAMAESE